MIEMTPDSAVRIYNLINSDKKNSKTSSLEPKLFFNIFPGLDSQRIIYDTKQEPVVVLFLKEEALTYLKNKYVISEISCLKNLKK